MEDQNNRSKNGFRSKPPPQGRADELRKCSRGKKKRERQKHKNKESDERKKTVGRNFRDSNERGPEGSTIEKAVQGRKCRKELGSCTKYLRD